MRELETPRLVLRMFERDDLDRLAEIYADPLVMRYVGDGQPRTRVETSRLLDLMLNQWDEQGFGRWAVVERGSRQLVGRCGFCFLDGTPEVEIGYLYARSYWGQGIATEAARVCLPFAFETLDFPRLVGVAALPNIASQRVLQKIGLTFEKNTRCYNTDVAYFSLASEEYYARKAPFT